MNNSHNYTERNTQCAIAHEQQTHRQQLKMPHQAVENEKKNSCSLVDSLSFFLFMAVVCLQFCNSFSDPYAFIIFGAVHRIGMHTNIHLFETAIHRNLTAFDFGCYFFRFWYWSEFRAASMHVNVFHVVVSFLCGFFVFRSRKIVIACNNGLFSVKHKVMSKCAACTPLRIATPATKFVHGVRSF